MPDNRTVIWKNYDATGRDLHVDVPLSNAILNYRTEGLLGETIFPVIPVTKQSNMIPEIPLGEFLRSEIAYRAPGTEANKVKFSISTQTYFCKNYALKYPLTIEDRENADEIWQVRQNGAYLITDLIRIQKELRVFSAINSSTNVSTIFLPSSAWNAAANQGDPIKQINKMADYIQDTRGFRPNNLLFGLSAWRSFMPNTFVRAILFPHGGGLASIENARQLFDMSIHINRAYYNTAGEGFTASLAGFFNDAVFLWYNPPGQGIGPLPRYSGTMRWSVPGVPNMAVEVHPYDSKIKSEEIEVGVYDAEHVFNTGLACIMKGVNSGQSGGITGA